MNPRQTADAIAAAMTARDHQALMDLYADDVVFHSPATAVTFRGKSEVGALMAHVLAGFESWQRTFVLADDEQCVFGAAGHIGGPDVELAEFIRLDPGRTGGRDPHPRPPPGRHRRHRGGRRAATGRTA